MKFFNLIEKIKNCIRMSEEEKMNALYTAHKNYLLKGGIVQIKEEFVYPTNFKKYHFNFEQVFLKATYKANSIYLIVKKIEDVVLLDNTIGHSKVLALNGDSLGIDYITLNQIEALNIIQNLGINHKVTIQLINISLENFKKDLQLKNKYYNNPQRNTKAVIDKLDKKTYLFTANHELLQLAMNLYKEIKCK